MKYFIGIFILIILISNVSAELIEGKSNYSLGETLISQLGFIPLQPISSSQIQLLKDSHILIPSESAVVRVGSDYFIYSSLPLNYTNTTLTLRIKDVYRMSGNSQVFGDVEKNISLSSNLVPYSILPGVIIAKEPKLNIKITSYIDSVQKIVVDQQNTTVSISPGENSISISTDSIPQGFSTLHIGDYQIPVYLDYKSSNSTANNSQNNSIILYHLNWLPSRIKGVVLVNKEVNFALAITNPGTKKISDIVLEYNPEIFSLSTNKISSLDADETYYLNLTVKKVKNNLDEVITARYNGDSVDLPITVLVTSNYSEVKTELVSANGSTILGKYCLELNGKACSANEVCSDATITTLDQARCCTGTCNVPAKNSKSWLGYLLGALALIILVIVGGKYLKSKNPQDAFAKRVSLAEKKI